MNRLRRRRVLHAPQTEKRREWRCTCGSEFKSHKRLRQHLRAKNGPWSELNEVPG